MFGLILAGLMRRRDDGTPPFTVMSCDNIPHNGHVTADARRRAGAAGRRRISPTGSASNVAFPNGMVDRITPATTDRERDISDDGIRRRGQLAGVLRAVPAMGAGGQFPDGRPALEKVGVQFVKDVAPFELMKIRILNGGHATIAYPAGLMDIHFVHEAMEEPLVAASSPSWSARRSSRPCRRCRASMLGDYFELIERRFSNPKIGDTVRRLCLDGSNRQPKFIIPTIADRLKAGKGIDRPGAGIGALVPLLLRHHRFRRGDRAQRPELGAAAGDREGGQGRSGGLAGHGATSMARSASRPSSRRSFGDALNALWKDGAAVTVKSYLHTS